MQKPIVVVGSINLDLVVSALRIPNIGETIIGDNFNTFSGGKGANQAVAVAKLGYPVSMVGNVGNDSFGAQLLHGLIQAGVDTTYVSAVEGPSGVALITTNAQGENTIVVVPGANGQLTPQKLEGAQPLLEAAGILLAQLEIPLESIDYLAELAERLNIPFILDPAPARELSAEILVRTSWLTPNQTEAKQLLRLDTNAYTDDEYYAADRLLALGVKNVLMKLGSHGCLVAQPGVPQHRLPAYPVKAVDSTAAGDAFNGAFAVALMRGLTPVQSATFASAVAAISVTRLGAQPSMPTSDEVKSFLVSQAAVIPV